MPGADRSMNANTPVLLIDGGELDSIDNLLEQLGVEFERLDGSRARIPVPHPEILLITSAALARSLRIERAVTGSIPRPTWIAFVDDDSPAQKSSLQTAGFDFLIREPVHPAALRVLVQRALFRGTDARRAPRVACGHPATYKVGLWRQKATLLDLSPRGCRLLVARTMKEKSEISIQIPKEMAGGRALDLSGHVVRVAPAERECGRDGETIVGVRFAPVEGDTRTRLRAVLAERVLGPAVLPAGYKSAAPGPLPAGATNGSSRSLASSLPNARQRPTRRYERARYGRKVAAMEGEDVYMLMCRDISVGGMRVEPVEGLAVGSSLDLAIQLSAREEPFLVEASVLRDDGELGLALQFTWIAPESQARLQELLAKLPSIEALQDDLRRQGTILAQRMPDEADENG